MTVSPMSNQPGRLPTRCSPSNISALIVGAGVAGLMAGLECWRKGHNVRIIEKSPARLTSGDGFTIGHSAIRVLRHWPDMAAEHERISYNFWISWHKITGEILAGPAPIQLDSVQAKNDGVESVENTPKIHRHSRPRFHLMLCRQLEKIGLEIEYGKRVVDYFEDSEAGKAGVLVDDGENIQADVVIAADGIGSKSSRIAMGAEVRARPTGFSMYRAALPIELTMADPIVRERFQLLPGGIPHAEVWMGDGVNAFFTVAHGEITWLLTYPDRGDSTESWSTIVDPAKALETTAKIGGWPEVADRLIRITPKEKLHDFKLMWREPQPHWVSPGGRVVQIGDAAHTLLPTSGNGAAQGIEDAVSLAACLRAAGKENVHWATRVHNKLRFERVTCLQKLGVINHESRHRSADANSSQAKPIGLTAAWIWQHDPERYAIDNYKAALAHLADGAPFQNTNTPPGYVHRPWTIDGLLRSKENGQELKLEEDWEGGQVTKGRL